MTDDIRKVINDSIASPFIRSVAFNNGRLTIELQEHADALDYWWTGDKLNKVLSIEVARWFCKLPGVDVIDVTVRLGEIDERPAVDERVVVSREDAVGFFGYELSADRNANPAAWGQFLNGADRPAERDRFVEVFGVEPEDAV